MQAQAVRLITVMLIATSFLACTKNDHGKPASPGRGHWTHPKEKKHESGHDGAHGKKHDASSERRSPTAAKHGSEGLHDAGAGSQATETSAPTSSSATSSSSELPPIDAGREIFAP